MTDKEFWTRVFLSLVKLGSETGETSGSASQIVLVAAAMADAALVEFRKRFAQDAEPVNKDQLRREHLEYRLGLERDRLAHLERTRPSTDGMITVAKSTIIQLEAILKGAI